MKGAELNWTASPFEMEVERRPDGAVLLRSTATLSTYPQRVTDMLEYWAERSPEAIFVARRAPSGAWQKVSYLEALKRVRLWAAGLAALELSAERPLVILSGNSIEHLLLSLAAMYIGVPYCPVSTAYSQASSDLSKLRYVIELLTPGLVAAFNGGHYARAIELTVPPATWVLGDDLEFGGRQVMRIADLEAHAPRTAEAAHQRTDENTIAKFLLTSGSAGHPKAVITTQRMLCSNQMMLREAVPFVVNEPPVLVDWLPWNHTFGGSHNVGLVLFNGGSLYIDDGKPLANAFAETIRNLREVSPTIYLNVPKGFDMLAAHLRGDPLLRQSFYRRLRTCFFAGAGLSQHTWDALDAEAIAETGRRVPMISGLGATETAPSVTFTTPALDRAGIIGLPAAGMLIKLAPISGKLELRVKGPNVTPGYWRLASQTIAAFDDEGFYRLGDAVRLLDPQDPSRGLVFDGRISEDFKLASGTWVSVGPLRTELLARLAPLVQDVIITGMNRDYVGALIVPDLRACAAAGGEPDTADAPQVASNHRLRERLVGALQEHADDNAGESRRVARAILLIEPLSLDRGEITDKGSINQRAVLEQRAELVEALYNDAPPKFVLKIN